MKYAPAPYPELYAAYRFDEPWNSPHNAGLGGQIGEFYRRQGLDAAGTHQTSFVAVVGAQTAWPGPTSSTKTDLHDDPATTILLIEAADPGINWNEPRDLSFDNMSFRVNDPVGRGPGSKIRGARALFANGKVHELPDGFDPATLRAMLTANGGETIEPAGGGWKRTDRPTPGAH